jgi:hypothetical protein
MTGLLAHKSTSRSVSSVLDMLRLIGRGLDLARTKALARFVVQEQVGRGGRRIVTDVGRVVSLSRSTAGVLLSGDCARSSRTIDVTTLTNYRLGRCSDPTTLLLVVRCSMPAC